MSQSKEDSPKGNKTGDSKELISETEGKVSRRAKKMAEIVGGQNQVGENGQRHGGGRKRNQRGCCRAGNRYRNRFGNSRRLGESICHMCTIKLVNSAK